jgi:hypothetical protein
MSCAFVLKRKKQEEKTMKKTMKRLMSLLIAALLALSMAALSEEFPEELEAPEIEVQLGDEPGVDEYHALRGGEGIDTGRGDGVESEFGTQAGVVFEQGVGYVRGEGADGVAVDDVATGQHAVDVVGGFEDLLLVAHTLASVLFGTLDVAVVELPHAHLQVGGHGSRAAQCLAVEGGSACKAD